MTVAASETTDNSHHSVSVAGIVVREDGRILAIQRRDTGQWQPPGGILELDETFEGGVCREVAEETGVTVEVERLISRTTSGSGPHFVIGLAPACRPME